MKDITYMKKWQDLLSLLKNKKRIAIACSGGLDSRLLAFASHISGAEYNIVHIKGIHIPAEEEEILKNFSEKTGIFIKSFSFNPLNIEEVKNNSLERCYFCKKAIFSFFLEKTENYILCDGSNTDDLKVYRPGLRALKELNIFSPYIEINISKEDIRNIAKEIELPFFNQPSQACLLTRYNYDIELKKDAILWVDKVESALKEYISFPFRMRGIEKYSFELHIESEEKNLSHNREEINKILNSFSKELSFNASINLNIKPIFMSNLRGYFDRSRLKS